MVPPWAGCFPPASWAPKPLHAGLRNFIFPSCLLHHNSLLWVPLLCMRREVGPFRLSC